jgi:hypothetical protein
MVTVDSGPMWQRSTDQSRSASISYAELVLRKMTRVSMGTILAALRYVARNEIRIALH